MYPSASVDAAAEVWAVVAYNQWADMLRSGASDAAAAAVDDDDEAVELVVDDDEVVEWAADDDVAAEWAVECGADVVAVDDENVAVAVDGDAGGDVGACEDAWVADGGWASSSSC